MKKEVFGIKDGVLIRYYENEKDDGNNDGMKKICTGAFAGCTELKEIRYGGTRAQWAAVQRGASRCGISVKNILCTDGTSADVGSNCDKDGMYFSLGA